MKQHRWQASAAASGVAVWDLLRCLSMHFIACCYPFMQRRLSSEGLSKTVRPFSFLHSFSSKVNTRRYEVPFAAIEITSPRSGFMGSKWNLFLFNESRYHLLYVSGRLVRRLTGPYLRVLRWQSSANLFICQMGCKLAIGDTNLDVSLTGFVAGEDARKTRLMWKGLPEITTRRFFEAKRPLLQ